MSTEDFSVRVRAEDGFTVIQVEGEIDAATASEVNAAVQAVIENGASRLIFDLALVSFLDSSGLAVLLTAARTIEKQSLAIVIAEERVRRIIAITGLEEILPTFETLAAAVTAIQPSK